MGKSFTLPRPSSTAYLLTTLLLSLAVSEGLRTTKSIPTSSIERGGSSNERHPITSKEESNGEFLMETGSTLPDCSHACGPCFPCKRVMVSFECSVAESCPIVYRCMCRGRYYHVPSN